MLGKICTKTERCLFPEITLLHVGEPVQGDGLLLSCSKAPLDTVLKGHPKEVLRADTALRTWGL